MQEGLTLVRLFTAILFGVCVWNTLWSKETEWFRSVFCNGVSVLIICYLGVSVLSMAASRTPANSIFPIFSRLASFLFFLMLVNIIRDRRVLRFCVWGILAGMVFTLPAGTYEMFTGDSVLPDVYITETMVKGGLDTLSSGNVRIQGLGYDPNSHGAWLVMQIGLLLYLLATAKSWRWRILGGGVLLLAIANIAATASRTAWGALFVCLALFFTLAPLRHKRLILFGSAGVACLTFAAVVLFVPQLAIVDKLLDTTGNSSGATRFRANIFRLSLEMGFDHPLLGVGTGNFEEEYPHYARRVPMLPQIITPRPHNNYLLVFAENGITGMTVYCFWHLAVVLQIIACIRSASDVDAKMMAIGLLVSFAGFFCCINFYNIWNNKYGWAIMGLAVALKRVLHAEREAQQNGQPGTLQPHAQHNDISSPGSVPAV